jgi:hypothetical protein
MKTEEIPRSEWRDFFDAFSKRHHGWLVSVEIMGADIGAQTEARDLPLQGITWDPHGGALSILLGEGRTNHVTHLITAPMDVKVQLTEEGGDETVQIQAQDGVTTLVRFRSAMLPEMVDGIASSVGRGEIS